MRWFIGILGALALLAVLGLVRGDTGRGDGLSLVVVTDHIQPGATCPPSSDNGSFKTHRWAIGDDLTYHVNEDVDAAFNAAIDDAFDTWSATAMGDRFIDGGTTDISEVALDGTNAVFFAPLSGNTIASTSIWFFTVSKEVAQFDMVFNSTLDWANLPGDPDDENDFCQGGGDYDVQAIATHEVGHPVGAGHTSPNGANNAQTMYPFGETGTIFEQTLAQGDLAAVEKIYGVGGGGEEDGGPPPCKGWRQNDPEC